MENEKINIDEEFMCEALVEADKAIESEDVPIGAVIVRDGKITGRGFNQIELTDDPTAHAEIVAIREAVRYAGHKHLIGATLYVTIEPCTMCAGAIVLSRIKRLVYGAADPKAGACGSLYTIPKDERLNHRCEISSGILETECSKKVKDFFKKIRAVKNAGKKD